MRTVAAALNLVVATVLAIEMGLVAYTVASKGAAAINTAPMTPDSTLPNVETIGRVLYTDYAYFFQAAGLVLLVAMIGAIVLTLRQRVGVRRQSIARQLARRRGEAVAIVKVPLGAAAAREFETSDPEQRLAGD